METEIRTTFRANGKLLFTAEYVVLDGALALAMPTRFGQTLSLLKVAESEEWSWVSYDEQGRIWFEGSFETGSGAYRSGNDEGTGRQLERIFQAIHYLRPEFKDQMRGIRVETHLDFPRMWGLGTSSTLIVNLCRWAHVDPFELLDRTFGGSGYDLACAQAPGPVFYQLTDGRPNWVDLPFEPPFSDQLFFVYLGKKQNSREGIARYREKAKGQRDAVRRVSQLTLGFIQASRVKDWESLIREHERLIAGILEFPRAKDLYFPGFWGEVKSLGAWGGDFVMLTSNRSEEETREYLRKKGLNTVFSYREMIKFDR